jgi:mycothiol synthase
MTDTTVAGDITVEEMDYSALTDEDIVALNTFENVLDGEAHPEDPPTPLELTRVNATTIPDFVTHSNFWARERDGTIAGISWTWWRKTEENRHLGAIRVLVRPDVRRRGIARVLVRHALDVVASDGRTLVIGFTSERVPAGERFAERVGAEAGSAIHTNRLLLDDVDPDLIRKWVDNGPHRAPGSSLLTIDGRYPDEIVDQVAKVYGVMNTAPRDDLQIEDETHTVEQIRQWEQSRDAGGTVRWSIFARHDASGELIGLTEIYWNLAEPDTMYQGDTGVDPGHRGHALGKWMKAQMIERILAERPEIVDIRTGNADSNDAMLAINDALGFRPYIAQMNWQVPVERLRAYLDGSST